MVHRRVSAHQREVLRERARGMRQAPEKSEAVPWHALRRRQLSVRCRRKIVLQGFIAGVSASKATVSVEVDGPWHAKRAEADGRRGRVLSAADYRVVRVTPEEVLHSLSDVLAGIAAAAGDTA